MSTFNPSDLFFLQRPSDTTDPYKAVTRDSMRALGIISSDIEPTTPDEGQLWFRTTLRQLYIYDNGQWVEAAVSTPINNLKVSRTGDTMSGDLVMIGEADVNFPLSGGLTLGNEDAGGHMILLSYDIDLKPTGFLTIPSPAGGLDSIARWDSFGLDVLKDPSDPNHATHKKYVDDENHSQDIIIEQNATNIIALFDDLESVRPSTVRTKYDHIIPTSYGDNSGEGRIYFGNGTNIVLSYGDDITEMYFNTKANNGIVYDISSVTQDYYVEIQDVKGIGIFLAEVVSVTELVGNVKIELNVLKYRDDGVLTGDPDPTEVRLLIFKKSTEIDIQDEDRFAKLFEPNTFTKNNTFEGPGVFINSLAPLPGATGFIKTTIFSVENGATGINPGKNRFNINSEGEVTAGTVPYPFMAQYDNDVVTKKYVDERMARVGAYYGDTPPANPVPGMLWYDTKEDDLTMYMFYENPDTSTVWTPVYSPTKGGGGGGSPFTPVSDINSNVYTTQHELNEFLLYNSLYKNDENTFIIDSPEELQSSVTPFKINGRHDDGGNLVFGDLFEVIRTPLSSQFGDSIFYRGEIRQGSSITNKKYVDDKDKALNDKIENFREDLQAISPILVRGQWKIDHIGTTGRAPTPGFFAIYKIASDYEYITDFIETHEIWIPEQDVNNVLHDFTEELILDKYIYIYDADDKDYVLAIITSLQEEVFRSNKYYKLIVKPIQAKGLPHDDDSCFIKIFDPPTGGDGSQFVTKSDFAEVTDPLISTILELTYIDGGDGTEASETNEFTTYVTSDYTEIYFRIEHQMAVKAAYDEGKINIDGVDYEVNYYEENESIGYVEIDTILTPEGFANHTGGEQVTFVLPKVCCYDDRELKNYIDDYNQQQDKTSWDIYDLIQEDMYYPVFKGTAVDNRNTIKSAGQLSFIYDDGYGSGYNVAIFGSLSDDICRVGDTMLIDFGDGIFLETTPVNGKTIYDGQYTYFRFGRTEFITPLPSIPTEGSDIQIKFPRAFPTKSFKLSTMMKDAVEASTDFDSLKSNLIQALDNYSQGN